MERLRTISLRSNPARRKRKKTAKRSRRRSSSSSGVIRRRRSSRRSAQSYVIAAIAIGRGTHYWTGVNWGQHKRARRYDTPRAAQAVMRRLHRPQGTALAVIPA